MRIWCLPPETTAPPTPLRRAHRPAGAWKTFRPCLRWDFGFTCALCLTHEASLAPPGPDGAERMGLLSIEHISPQSADRHAANRYGNCVLACSRGNTARQDTAVLSADGRRLLDPTRVAWADRFLIARDDARRELRVEPRAEDRDAAYTARTYDINEPEKSRRRYHRVVRIEALLQELRFGASKLARLDALASASPASQASVVAA